MKSKTGQLNMHSVSKALRSACGMAATVPPRSVGGARNSFHARSTIERGGIVANVSSVYDVESANTNVNMKYKLKTFKKNAKRGN
jgi:hypothetical protein